MNSKFKNKTKANERLGGELKGFEEVLDLLTDDTSRSEKFNNNNKSTNPFELFNFLEKEKERLEKVDLFFREKLPNLDAQEITPHLTKLQEQRLQSTRSELTLRLSQTDSPLMANLRHLFEKTFTSSRKE